MIDDFAVVFRSADSSAPEDAARLRDMLAENGVEAETAGDSSPGVPAGVYEVRVAGAMAARAEELIASNPLEDEFEEADPSHAMDLETVFQAPAGTNGEYEAITVKGMLEDAGIFAVMVGDAVLPNLSFEVRVAHARAGDARSLIEQAQTDPENAPEA